MHPFLRKFDLYHENDPETGCWVWQCSLDKDGYGMVRLPEGRKRAHRASYEYFITKIPDGLVTDHVCRNKACVNPLHLDLVTPAENTKRWAATVTHCPLGHEYTSSNTYTYNGCRACKTCTNTRAKARKSNVT